MVRDGSSSGRGPLSEEARAILDASPVPALALRDDLRILHANAAAVAAFGADVERAGSLSAWLESVARGDLAAVGRALSHLALPGLVLSTIPLAVVTRMTRSSMLEELGRDYVRTARAKGVRELGVVSRHAMKNALMPIVTVTGLQTGALLGGAVLTESVFAWPGLGRYVAEGVRSGNGPLVVAGVFTFAAPFVVVNLVVDVVYHAVDPRLRRAS